MYHYSLLELNLKLNVTIVKIIMLNIYILYLAI